jgi:acetylornithine deacetylase/succinyl-diaminopimelate desuccinylase-like protein
MRFNKSSYLKELGELVANNAIPSNISGLKQNLSFILGRLTELGFNVNIIGNETNEPIIYAFKTGNKNAPKVGIYSHYDVEPTNEDLWKFPSTNLTIEDERIFGRGVADNLGIWLLRMHVIASMGDTKLPEIHWLFQGQEEIGSPFAHKEFPLLEIPRMNLWLEETGYFDLTTLRQRFLTLNESDKLGEFKTHLTDLLFKEEFSAYTENRSLTKFDSCPFITHILKGQPYLALGPNDEYSKIHEPNESLSLPLIKKSFDQFDKLLKYYGNN